MKKTKKPAANHPMSGCSEGKKRKPSASHPWKRNVGTTAQQKELAQKHERVAHYSSNMGIKR